MPPGSKVRIESASCALTFGDRCAAISSAAKISVTHAAVINHTPGSLNTVSTAYSAVAP